MFDDSVHVDDSEKAASAANRPHHAFGALRQSGLRGRRRHHLLVAIAARLVAARRARIDQGRRDRALTSPDNHILRDIGLR